MFYKTFMKLTIPVILLISQLIACNNDKFTEIPESAELLVPTADEIVITTTPTFQWKAPNRGVESFVLQIDSNNFEIDFNNESFQQYTPDPSEALTHGTHQWRVFSVNDFMRYPSEVRSFIVLPPSTVEDYEFCANDTVEISLSTNNLADNYSIQIADDDQFANIVIEDSSPSPTFTITSLNPGNTYYYRTNIEVNSTTGEWSDSATITIHPAVTTPSNLQFSTDGGCGTFNTEFSWDTNSGYSYELELAKNDDTFSTVTTQKTLDNTEIPHTENLTLPSGYMYWRIRAKDLSTNCFSDWIEGAEISGVSSNLSDLNFSGTLCADPTTAITLTWTGDSPLDLEITTDDFSGVATHTSFASGDTVNLGPGTWRWQLFDSCGMAVGPEITISAPTGIVPWCQMTADPGTALIGDDVLLTWPHLDPVPEHGYRVELLIDDLCTPGTPSAVSGWPVTVDNGDNFIQTGVLNNPGYYTWRVTSLGSGDCPEGTPSDYASFSVSSQTSCAAATYDNSFSTDGRANFAVNGTPGSNALSGDDREYGKVIAVESDGDIVFGGYHYDPPYNFALMRTDSNGTFDSTFGTGGWVSNPGFSSSGYVDGIAVDSSDNIITVSNLGGAVGVARFLNNGTLDASFNGSGILELSDIRLGGAHCLDLQSDGKIVIAGYTDSLPGYMTVIRLESNGNFDATFGTGGRINIAPTVYYDYAAYVEVLRSGKIVLTGTVNALGSPVAGNFGAVRLLSDGSYDTCFNGTGYSEIQLGVSSFDFGNSLVRGGAVQADGKIIAVGCTNYTGMNWTDNMDSGIARWNADGSPDTSFSTDGYIIDDRNLYLDSAYHATVLNDGLILVSGVLRLQQSASNMYVARYNQDGTHDSCYGTDGLFEQSNWPGIPNWGADIAYDIYRFCDGDVLVAGAVNTSTWGDFAIMKLVP